MTKTPTTACARPSKKSPHPHRNAAGSVQDIQFYRANEKPYGPFSNLFRRPVSFEGLVYPTSEHAYQAGKARKPAVRDWILSAPTPALAAMAAHGLYVWDVAPDWAQTKFDRMRRVLRAKFDQHEDLRQLLLSTGEARLVEVGTVNNAVNRLWGEVDGKGENMLGVMLMELRAAYVKEAAVATAKPARAGSKARTKAKTKSARTVVAA
ncbi:NADAR family protein [Pelomonas aquatica]|jgi:ribA/ribD-fused uncharacterized protein|uniref:NADAR family protein n=1 Tax=Pelomonas aquatica TaxID=431058 RepID=A0A9X4LIV6_9BURK|nr:NADAR family protein [Pelomonas aquatica]MCY4754650.1 NADAR family protein [Pelomonas aquatica]MDG0863734.1 NADAR family protein [Pelomonas aquatica]